MNAVDRWRALAEASAAKWGRALGILVPVDLVLAIVRKESSGDTLAVRREPDGRISRGLMQVLEPTARDLGLKGDLRQLHVPAVGIDYGTHYLAQQLKRYGGSIPRAIAAYNAGSVRYDARERFVNQTYVDKVLGFLRGAGGAGVVGAIAIAVVGVLALRAVARRRAPR